MKIAKTREWLYDESIAPGVDYAKDDSVALYEHSRAAEGASTTRRAIWSKLLSLYECCGANT